MDLKVTVVFVTHSVEEAIYLGDRVIVMGARPGRINADIETDRNDGTEIVKLWFTNTDNFPAAKVKAMLREHLKAFGVE